VLGRERHRIADAERIRLEGGLEPALALALVGD
jgi:hypothetical protein